MNCIMNNSIAEQTHPVVRHARYVAAYNAISSCLRKAMDGRENVSLMVLGASGSGKTTLVREVLEKYPPVLIPGKDQRTLYPVVYAEVPAAPTIKSTAERILGGMGLKAVGSAEQLTHQLVTLLRAAETKVLLLDEAQHFSDRGGVRSWSVIADWLKSIVNQTKVTLLVFGLPSATKLLETNDQLRRRFVGPHLILPWRIEDKDDVLEFRRFAKALIEAVGFPGSVPSLLEPDTARRLFFATDGRVGQLCKLIIETAYEVAGEDGRELTAEHLSTGFRNLIWVPSAANRDPFDTQFNFKPLVTAGEPYAPVR